jgi:hypothetical protein
MAKNKIWIRFEDSGPSRSGKTREWDVLPFEGNGRELGTIKWYGPWRKYCFCPVANVVFEQDCLRCIADFCAAKTAEHKRKAVTHV